MKVRTNFVSNSSSSSFICAICGNKESGWDMSLSNAEMFECTHNHTVCESHRISLEDCEEGTCGKCNNCLENEDKTYYAPIEHCPLCMLQDITEYDLSQYLLKKYNLTKEEVLSEIRDTFKSYKNLINFKENK